MRTGTEAAGVEGVRKERIRKYVDDKSDRYFE